MKLNKTTIITTLACLLPMLMALAVYDRLPDLVAVHFNFAGEADSYAPKAMAVFGLPLLMAGINLITNIALDHDPKRANASKMLALVGRWTVPVMSFVVMGITILKSLGAEIAINKVLPAIIGVLFFAIGNYMPKCKQNYTVGVKTPWTLSSEENWNKTHRLSGYLWMGMGALLAVSGFFSFSAAVFIVIILSLAVVPIGYSFWLYKKGI